MGSGTVEHVSQFPYLDSLITESGQSHEDSKCVQGFRSIEKSCFQGLQFVSEDREESV